MTWLPRSISGSSVYVVGDDRGWHKIGVTANITLRLEQLSRDLGHRPVHLVHMVFGDIDSVHIENIAHWSLIDYENRYEWFNVPAERAIAAVEEAKRRREAGEYIAKRFAVQKRLVVIDDINARIPALLKPGETRHRFIESAVLAELSRRAAVAEKLERENGK